jgi:hypothetical protein
VIETLRERNRVAGGERLTLEVVALVLGDERADTLRLMEKLEQREDSIWLRTDLVVAPLVVACTWAGAFRFDAVGLGGSPSPKRFPRERLRCLTGREGDFETSCKVARLRIELELFGLRRPASVSSSPAKCPFSLSEDAPSVLPGGEDGGTEVASSRELTMASMIWDFVRESPSTS